MNSKNDKLVSACFTFTLFLHKDEAPLLNYIQDKLNLGKVRVYDHFAVYNINSKIGLVQLI